MSEEFSTGVKILLQRMETHPEEFFVADELERDRPLRPSPKWHSVMTSVMQVKGSESARGEASYLTEAEVDALWEGYRKIRRKAFDDYVMGSVLNPEELSSSDLKAGMIRFNQVLNHHERYDGKKWVNLNQSLTATIVGAGGGGGGYGGGGGGGGSVVVKTPKGTHTFTKNGVVTINTDEEITWLPKS